MPRSTMVFSLVVLGALAAVLGAGCRGDIGDDANVMNPDTCGSRTANGEYYDFRTGGCVRPTSTDELNKLYVYAQTYRLSQAHDETTTFDVTFSRPLPWKEASAVLERLGKPAIAKAQLHFPHVAHGLNSGITLTPAVTPEAFTASVKQQIATRYATAEHPVEVEVGSALPIAIDNGDFEILTIAVSIRPSEALTWWAENGDSIGTATPLSSALPWPHESEEFAQ